MNRISERFKLMKKQKRCGVIAYVTCGDPDLQTTIDVVLELERNGADVIELGLPFSDPIADGPVIQAASSRALLGGTTTDDVFKVASAIRAKSEIPLIAFSYYNPLLAYGAKRFVDAAAAAGIDGVLPTDLPPEDAVEFREHCRASGLSVVFLLSPTSSDTRLKLIDRCSDSFVYYVSTTGVTGTRRDLDPSLIERLEIIGRRLRKPLAVGFGISENAHYVALAPHCDAIVIGSAIVQAVADGDSHGAPKRAGEVLRGILTSPVKESLARELHADPGDSVPRSVRSGDTE